MAENCQLTSALPEKSAASGNGRVTGDGNRPGGHSASVTPLRVAPVSDATDSEITPERPPDDDRPRKRGRPKGLPKTGGRKKGSPKSWTAPELRDALLEKSNAVDLLCDVCAGKQIYVGPNGSAGKEGWRYPSMQQRLQALQIVLSKVLPDLRATDITTGGESIGSGDWSKTFKGPFASCASKADCIALLRALRGATRNDPEARSRVEAWASFVGWEHWTEVFGDEPQTPTEDSDGVHPEPPALAGEGEAPPVVLPSPSPDTTPLQVGDTITLPELGGWSCMLDGFDNAGTGRWWIADAGGMRHRRVTGDKDKAIETARELAGLKANAHGEITGPTRKAIHTSDKDL